MQVQTKNKVTLLKLKTVGFKNTKGEDVSYKEYTILDENNDTHSGTCRKSFEKEDLDNGDSELGFALFDVVAVKDSKLSKLKLADFGS